MGTGWLFRLGMWLENLCDPDVGWWRGGTEADRP